MIPAFTLFPPEVNSALIFGGAGSGPLFAAAAAWDSLASDLSTAAASFNTVVSALAGGMWTGPASLSMAAAAMPYVGWLSAAAGQAEAAASQALAAATAFESAHTATVLPAAVATNRVTLATLIATNILGQNTPAIALNEIEYVEMWAQDVAAMVSYYVGSMSVTSLLPSFSLPPLSLAGLQGAVSSAVSQVTGVVSSAASPLVTGAEAAVSAVPSAVSGAVSEVSTLSSELPLSSLESVAQIGMMPVSMMMSPIMMAAQAGAHTTPALAGASQVAADVPKFVGATSPAMKGLGGMGGLGSALSNGLGKARLVGSMSVPPNWQGSSPAPARLVSTAMSGLGAEANAAAPAAGGMPMMPMPMGAGAGGGMSGGPLGRGGVSPNMPQDRPSVVPRVGVG
jgi:PPE-repeat protein